MKKLSFLLLAVFIAFTSCKKSSTFDIAAQAATDDSIIQAYIKANNIPAIKDPTGLYYEIITPGTGATATAGATVNVNYIGKLTDGTIFDQTTTATGSKTFILDNTVIGWQIGIPYVKAGGRILLIVPSGQGYGNAVSGTIPANSVLIFTIDLLSVR